ncbi:putative copper/silver efflux system, membrane fusion protein CusB [Aliarcobacter faecis]|uniref:efflux RND transporter periplasmic adaptor subunit n=1 Tax=Aliarcobacter faecis TaxID=1564138 RepID=UPI00047D70A2|nr:efflux RND transporter periplasmic adaptor subunit [Aliarcobacter faecis]QKF74339.1 putative copper/silver efflux system, membrane fusion protein CusB [Aliarcobacter faecis]
MRKIFLGLFIVALTLNSNPIDAKQLFNIERVKVKKESFNESKEFYGITKLNESGTLDIVSRFDGYITYLNANKNYMNIKKGEALYTIYSSDIATIKNEIEIAKELNQNLYQKANSKLTNFDIQNAKFINNEVVINSPISGIITQKNVNNKSFVEKGKTLFQISSLEDIWFIASIYQEDLKFIKANMSAKIKIDGFDETILSKVDFIYPVFNENKTIEVRFVLENSKNKILPTMFGKVRIEQSSKEILSLPSSAVIKKESNYYVFIPKENGEFTPKKIEAIRVLGDKYEIISGLNENDEVINNSLFLYDADAMTNRLFDIKSSDEW